MLILAHPTTKLCLDGGRRQLKVVAALCTEVLQVLLVVNYLGVNREVVFVALFLSTAFTIAVLVHFAVLLYVST